MNAKSHWAKFLNEADQALKDVDEDARDLYSPEFLAEKFLGQARHQ